MTDSIIIPNGAKTIPLTRGMFAIVDESDYEWLAKFSWQYMPSGYARRGLRVHETGVSKAIMMHRQIINAPVGMLTDHINRNKLDNRRCNLRLCTPGQNSFNQGKQRFGRASSNYRGVFWATREERWEAKIYAQRKQYFLGYFDTAELAAMAYNDKAKELYGEFAGLNQLG